MGIYNRDYIREMQPVYGVTPVIKFIIIANIVVFLLQIFFVREVPFSPLEHLRRGNPELYKRFKDKEAESPEALEKFLKKHPEFNENPKETDDGDLDLDRRNERVSIIQEWFELDTEKVMQGQIWRLLTHAFCHDRYSLWHILFNMVVLYYFGCTVESMYGSREFLLFYLTAALVSALAFVGLDLRTGQMIPAIGASGAVMAVTMLYTMHFPYETIRVFWFFPLEMRWVMCLYLIWDLHPVLLALAGDRMGMFGGIAHAGHLGGLAFGFFYHRYQWRLDGLLDRLPSVRLPEARRLRPARARPTLRLYTEPEPDPHMDRVDEILEKISKSGKDSLTDEERATLNAASERIKNRPNH